MNNTLKLKDTEIEFLYRELGYSKKQLEKVSKEEWQEIREKCFFIEADETQEKCSEKGELAADIASIKYRKLFS